MPGGAHENMKAWSPEEDTLIIAMHESEGPKWSKIVQRLPGRTVSSVRNRWQRIEKGRKLREAGVESKNRCHACGQPKRGHVCYAKLNGGPQVDVRSGLSVKPSLQGGPAFGMAPPAPRTNLKELLTNSGRTGSMSDLFKSEVFSTDSTGLFPAPPAGSAGNPLFRVDLDATAAPLAAAPPVMPGFAAPPAAGPPALGKNLSFFSSLAQEMGGLTTPRTAALFDSLATDGATNVAAPPLKVQPSELKAANEIAMSALATDDNAPPGLRRAASGELGGPPKLTRRVTSFLNEFLGGDTPTSDAPSDPLNAPTDPLNAPTDAAPPMLERRRSSRLSLGEDDLI